LADETAVDTDSEKKLVVKIDLSLLSTGFGYEMHPKGAISFD
jgi:hypothetical protein